MAVKQSASIQKRVYIPPSDELIDEFASAICDHFGSTIDQGFRTSEVKQGFANFLKLMAAIRVEQLNEGQRNNQT